MALMRITKMEMKAAMKEAEQQQKKNAHSKMKQKGGRISCT